MTKRRNRNGKINNRDTIKARQSLDFKSWVENVKWNQEVVRSKQKENKINISPVRED